MKNVMLVGPSGCGKTTLCQALNGMELRYQKTQAVQVVAGTIDTPGEYLENRSLYRALSVSAAPAEMILLLQQCTDTRMLFPPGFASMFGGKPVVGLITKTDLPHTPKVLETVRAGLLLAGAGEVLAVSSLREKDLQALRALLK